MGLKIVDVVSLQGGSDFAKNVWGEPATIGKLVPPYSGQMPVQTVHRPPVLVPTSTLQSVLQSHRPILPMPQSRKSRGISLCPVRKCSTIADNTGACTLHFSHLYVVVVSFNFAVSIFAD
jgi:hypothetical protein